MAEVDGFCVVPHANRRAGASQFSASLARRQLTFRCSGIVHFSAYSRQVLMAGRRAAHPPAGADAAIAWRSKPSSFGARPS